MNEAHREEKDLIGKTQIPTAALYGIHTARAIENFPLTGRKVNHALIKAYGLVKLACAITNQEVSHPWTDEKYNAICSACRELADGLLYEHIMTDALQGGAGTSTNMNVNEVIANRALQILGHAPGSYEIINPIEDINLHQSTNDTYPTALKIAAIFEIRILEKALVRLLEAFQKKEKEFEHIVKVARTQMQDAVLTTLGRTMSAFAEALGRDRWRIYKCEERLKTVNLGGTAIGTGISAPRQYIFKVSENLKRLTDIAVTRAENLVEATQNNDVFAEVSGILNALASNLLKISGDLRLMSSGPDAGFAEINLPPRQAGSSIMPGKINPVIPEAVSQAALTVLSNNVRLTTACSLGSLELNPFMPLIAESLLESIKLLKNAASIMTDNCVNGITANEKKCASSVNGSTATLTALIDSIGYEKAEALALEMKNSGRTLRELVIEKSYMTGETFDMLISAESVMMLGKKPRNI